MKMSLDSNNAKSYADISREITERALHYEDLMKKFLSQGWSIDFFLAPTSPEERVKFVEKQRGEMIIDRNNGDGQERQDVETIVLRYHAEIFYQDEDGFVIGIKPLNDGRYRQSARKIRDDFRDRPKKMDRHPHHGRLITNIYGIKRRLLKNGWHVEAYPTEASVLQSFRENGDEADILYRDGEYFIAGHKKMNIISKNIRQWLLCFGLIEY